MTRRSALLSLAAASAAASRARAQARANVEIDDTIVAQDDQAVENYLERQNTDPESRWRGAIPDRQGLHNPGSASGVIARGVASYLLPSSRYYQDETLRKRISLAIDHLKRTQTADGNFDLLTTNFNSPPDTAFIMLNVGPATSVAKKWGDDALFNELKPLILKMGEGLVKGGVHTPNHRWVVTAALAITNDIFPDERYVKRAEQWLAEGIDIDSDGQYSEQSTAVYNSVSNNALVTTAYKMNKPELLEPVRKNLEAMMYLLHPGFEVVTEISHRQDRNTVGTMGRYWQTLRYMARVDKDGRYETLAKAFEPRYASAIEMMDWEILREKGPKPKPVPTDYAKTFPNTNLVHIRRDKTSASILLEGNSRIFSVRRGAAVINGVRFASAFFGKAQFVPTEGGKEGKVYRMKQSLQGPYYQPFVPTRKQPWGVDKWYELRVGENPREQTEVAKLEYVAEIEELKNGFNLHIKATGTDWIPLAVEINLREGGTVTNVTEAPDHEDAYLLGDGEYATYKMGGDSIRFGPGIAETGYTQVRGAQEKLPGQSIYLTTYTPVDRVIEFRW